MENIVWNFYIYLNLIVMGGGYFNDFLKGIVKDWEMI